VDGIYDADPVKNPKAKSSTVSPNLEVLQKGLRVMDTTAISLCMDNHLPIIVYDLKRKGNLRRIVVGETIGTLVKEVAIATQADGRRREGPHAPDRDTVLRELATMRTGRASVAMLDTIRRGLLRQPHPLNQVGNLAVPRPDPHHAAAVGPSLLPAIEKAIRTSDPRPQPPERRQDHPHPGAFPDRERRKNLVKVAHKHVEEGRWPSATCGATPTST